MKIDIYGSKDLNFVEINITGGNDACIRCDKESKFIDTAVFNLFTPCFEAANKLYDYYGPTKFNSRKIIPLRNELINYLQNLEGIDSKESFIHFINDLFLGKDFLEEIQKNKIDLDKKWKEIYNQLKKVNKEMIQIAEKCADEERILWVIGY